jgi:hypothetical protein
LFVGEKSLEDAQQLLARFSSYEGNEYEKARITDSSLWEAKRVVDSALNANTGEVIHPIARMCAFIPASVPITLGMLTMTSTFSVVALQWINQSYNAVFNYSHRSQAGTDKSQVLKAYALATGTSCGLALGLSRVANRIRHPWLIATFAVMAAGSANVAFTRSNEMTQGVNVFDENGSVIGTSKIAGKYAVGYTILSRSILLPIPIMVVPGYMSQLIARRLSKSGPPRKGSKLLIDVGCIILSQAIALPVCIAAFPQTITLKRSQLEREFHQEVDNPVFVRKGV